MAPSGPIELTFPRDVIRVGIYSTSFPGSVSLSAYAAGGALLETVSIPAVAAAGWSSNFLGIEDLTGIRKVEIFGTSNMQVADDLTFEYASVPVLPTGGALLLWTALAAVGRLVPPRQGRR